MALRIQYTFNSHSVSKTNPESTTLKYRNKLKIIENVENAVKQSLRLIKPDETLYILPTYPAMLEIRKILTGKKIL